MKTTYNDLVAHARSMFRHFDSVIHDEKRGIQLLKHDGQIARNLSWQAEGWIQAEARNWWVHLLSNWLEKVARDEDITLIEEEKWDAEAYQIITNLGAECLRTILRGAQSSGNIITAMEERAKMEAAAWALENICGVSAWQLGTDDSMDDVMKGIQRRRDAQEAERMKVPRKVIYKKVNGCYIGELHNCNGKELDSKNFGTGNKTVAKAAARTWAEEVNAEHKVSIIVDEVK